MDRTSTNFRDDFRRDRCDDTACFERGRSHPGRTSSFRGCPHSDLARGRSSLRPLARCGRFCSRRAEAFLSMGDPVFGARDTGDLVDPSPLLRCSGRPCHPGVVRGRGDYQFLAEDLAPHPLRVLLHGDSVPDQHSLRNSCVNFRRVGLLVATFSLPPYLRRSLGWSWVGDKRWHYCGLVASLIRESLWNHTNHAHFVLSSC